MMIHHSDQKFFTVMKVIIMMKIHHYDKNSSNVKNQHCDKNSALFLELSIVIIFMMVIRQNLHYDEHSSV